MRKMLILSNGLTDNADEGFLKVASSLVKRLKNASDDALIVSYDREPSFSDVHLSLNKLLLNGKLFSLIRQNYGNVLYIPFPAKTIFTALRIFVLSLFSTRIKTILVMKSEFGFIARLLLKLSRAEIVVLSNDSFEFYSKFLPVKRLSYIKTGVDTQKFIPADKEKQRFLKSKYGFSPDKKLILHVGHLNRGRNIAELMKISSEHQVLLVVSPLFKNEYDIKLKEELLSHSNISILDSFLPNIEEIYQACDAYFFPVVESGRCIDVPLSALEAAACGKPVVTTAFGEMKTFLNTEGFYFIKSFDKVQLNKTIEFAISDEKNPRNAVIPYDWQNGIIQLLQL